MLCKQYSSLSLAVSLSAITKIVGSIMLTGRRI
jgi:hypothetical protein